MAEHVLVDWDAWVTASGGWHDRWNQAEVSRLELHLLQLEQVIVGHCSVRLNGAKPLAVRHTLVLRVEGANGKARINFIPMTRRVVGILVELLEGAD